MRCAKSPRRGERNAGWVCESTKPGSTRRPRQSSSMTSECTQARRSRSSGSRSTSRPLPTAAMRSPAISTAAFLSRPISRIRLPRRGPVLFAFALPCSEALGSETLGSEPIVTSCEMRRSRSSGGPCGTSSALFAISCLLAFHRNLDARADGKLLSLVVARVRLAGHPYAWVISHHALDAPGHFIGAIGNRDLPRMLRVSDAYAAAVVDGEPRCARGGIEQRIEQGPIGDGVAAVPHAFGLAKGRCHRAAVEVVASHHHRRLELAELHEAIDRQAELGALAVTQPADARGQSLEADALLRQFDPAAQAEILGKHLQHQLVAHGNVARCARQGDPAEGTAPLAEERTNISLHKTGKVVGVLHSLAEGKGADIVAVIERDRAHLLHAQHAFDVVR